MMVHRLRLETGFSSVRIKGFRKLLDVQTYGPREDIVLWYLAGEILPSVADGGVCGYFSENYTVLEFAVLSPGTELGFVDDWEYVNTVHRRNDRAWNVFVNKGIKVNVEATGVI